MSRERVYSTFRRYIGFAEAVDAMKVSATIADGILEVKLPKLETEPEKKNVKKKPQ